MSGEARRLAAIMFTDIVGYSALTQKNEALTDELLQEHNDVVRAMLPQFGGKEIKTIGDAFHVEFASALDATRCAIAIQKALIEHNASALPERRIQLRIGLHVGDVMPREEDVFGDTVNIASRIVPLAEPGGICISEDVAHQIRNKIEARLVSLGRPDLKNIETPIEVYRIVLPWEKGDAILGRSSSDLRARRVRRLAIGLLVVAILGGTIWFVSPHIGWLPPTTANPNGVKTVTEPKPASAMKWIAVLPFDNTSNDAANEYFSDGMTDELISALSQVEGLRVIARTTAFMFKGKKGNVHKIGEQLNVGIVLDGSVQKAGEKIRISAHLLNATDGSELWAKTYDRELKDAFATQDEIAQAIVNVLKIKLGQPVVKPSTANQAAHDLYLRGRYSQSQATEEAIEKAIEYYEQAIAKDPNYALAYAALSGAYTALPGLSSVPAKEFYDKAKVAALKAVELDDGLPEAHLAVADNKYFMEGNYTDAEKEYKRALELDPNHEQVLLGYASFLYDQDRKEEALAIVEHVLERDPLNVDVKLQAADWFNYLHQYDRALEQVQQVLQMQPDSSRAYTYLALVKDGKLDWKGEEEAYRRVLELGPGEPLRHLQYASYLLAMGRTEESMQELKRVEEINPSLPALHYLGGRILYSVHEYDRAIEMFRKLFKSDPTYSASTHEELAKVYWQMGRYEEGVEEDLQWWANIEESEFIWFGGTEPIDQFRKSFASVEGELRQAFRESGLRGYLQKVITFLSGKSKYKCWGTWGDNIAVRYALLGETDKAVECLNMYADSLRPSEALLTSRAPAFDGIRSDPKFIAWLKKWGLEK